MRPIIVLLFLLIGLQACSFSGSPAPEEHFYRLPEQSANKAQQRFDTIYIRPVMAEGIYNERAILYVKDDSPLEVRRYRYHYWLNTPGKLVHEQLTNYLTTMAIGRQIVNRRIDGQDLEISLRIRNFERLTGASNRVLVTLQLEAYVAGHIKPALAKTYRLESPAGTSMHDTAAAFGQVLGALLGQISDDISSLKKY